MQSFAKRFPNDSRQVNPLLGIACVLFLVGIFGPLITIEKFFVFANTFTLIPGVFALLIEGQVFLFVVVFVFSILLPAAKIGVVLRFWNKSFPEDGKLKKYVHWIAQYGKWSMLDVFVVAVLLATVKLSAVASVEVHYGLYAFGASVLLTMFVTGKVVKRMSELDNP